MVCHHPDKFSNHNHYDIGDLMFLIFHVTSQDHVLKGWKSHTTSYHLAIFGSNLSSRSEGITYSLYQVTSQDHLIEESWGFMFGTSSLYPITLLSLVAIDIVVVVIKSFQWLKSKIPHARLYLPLLFSSKGHDLSCSYSRNFTADRTLVKAFASVSNEIGSILFTCFLVNE